MSTLRLAERMGAKASTLRGDSIAGAVTEFASKNNITKIVVGKPQKSRWQNLFGRSVVNQIIRRSEHLDVYIIGGNGEEAKQDETPGRPVSHNRRGYLKGLGLVVLATLLGQLVHELFAPTNMVMIYLLFVAVTAIFWGFGPSILASILSVFAFDFFFVPPFFSFAVDDTEHLSTLVALLLVGLIISYLTTWIRRQTEAARRRERETATLYALSRDLTVSNDLDSYIRAIIKRTKETFGRETIIFLPDVKNKELLVPHSGSANFTIDEKEAAAALWSFQHQKIIGYGTDTLPSAKARYFPLITARGAAGVMALWSTDTASELTIEQERLLEAYADLDALAIEGIQLAEEAHNAQILRATEKLQTALLNSISHDLRTPLVSIIGALSSLQEEGMGLDDTARKNLIQVAGEEAERLNHLITNLLDMSRIDAGAIIISRQSSDLEDIIGVALKQLSHTLVNRQVRINIPAELPFVSVDFGLILQTLVNILDNAFKYSPADSPVEISAHQVGQEIQIEVADKGIGIPPQDLTRVFDKFYRVQRPDYVTGTGLGLSICKGFVEAHGGHIWAENRPGGGTVIKLTLPIAEVTGISGNKNG